MEVNLSFNISKSTAGDMVDLYLSRSKSCLINITFTQLSGDKRVCLNPRDPLFDSKNFGTCLKQLVPHVACWRQFVVENLHVEEQVKLRFSVFADLCAPALRRMVIDCTCTPPMNSWRYSLWGVPVLCQPGVWNYSSYLLPIW